MSSACSTTTARPAWSRAALAGRLQRWRSHSECFDSRLSDTSKYRIMMLMIYKFGLWTNGTMNGTFSTKTRESRSRDWRRTSLYKFGLWINGTFSINTRDTGSRCVGAARPPPAAWKWLAACPFPLACSARASCRSRRYHGVVLGRASRQARRRCRPVCPRCACARCRLISPRLARYAAVAIATARAGALGHARPLGGVP